MKNGNHRFGRYPVQKRPNTMYEWKSKAKVDERQQSLLWSWYHQTSQKGYVTGE